MRGSKFFEFAYITVEKNEEMLIVSCNKNDMITFIDNK